MGERARTANPETYPKVRGLNDLICDRRQGDTTNLNFRLLPKRFNTARQAASGSDEELAILALQYMAECRLWQKRASEALTIYLELQKKLPCVDVDEERIQTRIKNAMHFSKNSQPTLAHMVIVATNTSALALQAGFLFTIKLREGLALN